MVTAATYAILATHRCDQEARAAVTLTSAELAAVNAVDPDVLTADLAALVEIPSVGGTSAEIDVQQWCADRLAELGATVDHWKLDLTDLRAQPDYPGEEVDRREGFGCVANIGPTAGKQRPALILAGHTDVVPAGDLGRWTHHPWRLHSDHDLAFGRGASDMKGGLAAILAAVHAITSSGLELRRPLAVHATIGEEDGGIGAYATLRRGHTGDACVIAEPTDASVIPANAGSLTFRLVVPGRAAHGASRLDGHSAIEAFTHLHGSLRELERRRNGDIDPVLAHLPLPYPISVGIVTAGEWASTVPERLVAEGRYGVRLDEPVADARAEFESAVAKACAADPWLSTHPADVSWPGGTFAPGRLPAGHRLIGDVSDAFAATEGWEPAVRGAPYGSDLRLYSAAGIPAVQAGPGSFSSAHAADECVSWTELLAFARVYTVLAVRMCGASDSR